MEGDNGSVLKSQGLRDFDLGEEEKFVGEKWSLSKREMRMKSRSGVRPKDVPQ